MDIWFFLPLLALMTLLAGTVFGLMGKRAVEKRLDDPDAPKSTLASDVPSDAAPADV
ncbi:hypothetical protein [Actibacterium sp. 188UL27-1]|uniref:hypothetical protein n=1 Tax=Actibacterium sp. 188UL27-1 TaxID=2786961 RepID=UPI00195A94A5|nr:hypothetical protein [Actibacterium sp. 188UL27-1]MBM7068184.1 hypothetical protein [Actibacterium sp. 188UL27-1]